MKPPIHPKTKKLTDIAELESIYRTWMRKNFAEDELKPFSMIAEAWEKGVYDCYVLTEQETILGYACFMRQDNSFLIDYLAVSAEIYTELYHRVRRDPALRSQFRILKNE